LKVDFCTATPPRYDSPAQPGYGFSRPMQHQRLERTKEEVAELKAARKAEIERRCMLLDPPLTSNVLAHMSSFQAALQIIKPVDDNAWELLKPRLLSQREEAEQREADRMQHTRVVQERSEERRNQDAMIKDAKDSLEREWEDVQVPLRARIGGYADEIIRDGWNEGEKVTNDNSPKFAAEVLIYVRRRFYDEVARDETANRAAGKESKVDPVEGPFTQKLTLENMKWVYDMKIKPHTEQYRKELFICNGCENNFKFYGFEGVIQHYAAKHTSALSVGSIVVHWRSEWPEHPPFHPEPAAAKAAYHGNQPSFTPYTSGPQAPINGGYALSAPQVMQIAPPYQQTQGPLYGHPPGHPPMGDPYGMQQSNSYGLPQQYNPGPMNYPGPQVAPYQPYQEPHNAGFPGQSLAPALQAYESPQPAQSFPAPSSQALSSGQSIQPYTSGVPQPAQYQTVGNVPQSIDPQQREIYKFQLEEVALVAREVWNSTTGLKEMPGSIRVYTIFHHVAQRFRAKFAMDPPLAMLIDGLSNNKDMRPVRNINSLSCKACARLLASGQPLPVNSSGPTGGEGKTFSLPQLCNHFQSAHIAMVQDSLSTGPGQPPDWITDMVELPSIDRITRLMHMAGMDDHKLGLIAAAIPAAFPTPLPRLATLRPNAASATKKDTNSKANRFERYNSQSQRAAWGQYHENSEVASFRDQSQNPEIGGVPILIRSGHTPLDESAIQRSSIPLSQRYYRRRASPDLEQTEVDEYGREVIRASKREVYRYDEHSYEPYLRPRQDSLYYEDANSLPRQLEMLSQKGPPSAATASEGAQNYSPHHSLMAPMETQPRQQSVSRSVLSQQETHRDRVDTPAEDGELRTHGRTRDAIAGPAPSEINAAERFLNDFIPGESAEEYAKKAEAEARRQEEALRAGWAAERVDTVRRIYQPVPDQDPRAIFELTGRNSDGAPKETRPTSVQGSHLRNERPVQGRPSHARQFSAHDYADRYGPVAPSIAQPTRERSPELVDHRYKRNNVVYREERQASQGARRTPSRYARYESVRLENDRAHSRSPLYVKVGSQLSHYRDHSQAPRGPLEDSVYRTGSPQPAAKEAIYHSRSPQTSVLEPLYQRAPPRQEYYRVYADGHPRARQPQYIEEYEYIQVADPQGDYMIRRPIRRIQEPYPEEAYVRQAAYETHEPVYESRQPLYENREPIRAGLPYDEEYDPRHPAPPPTFESRQPHRYI
jgi:hypothetical protein